MKKLVSFSSENYSRVQARSTKYKIVHPWELSRESLNLI